MDKTTQYVIRGIGIGIVIMLLVKFLPGLLSNKDGWIMLMILAAAAIATMSVQLYITAQKFRRS